MKKDSPLPARIALGIVAAIGISIPLGITLHDAQTLALVERTQKTTEGQVIYKHCQNHGKVGYSYMVEGQSYKGAGPATGRSCDDVEVGETIDIIYSSEKPRISRSDSLQSWRGQIFGGFLMAGWLSVIAAGVIFQITRVDDDDDA